MVTLLARQEVLDPALVAALQRQTPNLVIEAETMSREFRAIADSKFVRVISLLDGVNPDQWTDQNREDFELVLQGPNTSPLDEELTREVSLHLPQNWKISEVYLSMQNYG